MVDVDDKDTEVSANKVDSLGEATVVTLTGLVSRSDLSSTSTTVVEAKLYSHMGPP